MCLLSFEIETPAWHVWRVTTTLACSVTILKSKILRFMSFYRKNFVQVNVLATVEGTFLIQGNESPHATWEVEGRGVFSSPKHQLHANFQFSLIIVYLKAHSDCSSTHPPSDGIGYYPLTHQLLLSLSFYHTLLLAHYLSGCLCTNGTMILNPLNAELNPICYLLTLLVAHHFLHLNRIRVKSLTLRLLMLYIYGAPILDVSR